MGKKFNLNKVKLNPKKKKPNKNHKQKYHKPENKKVNKDNFYEITGNREELKEYKGEEFIARCFLTNTYKYSREKRLINSLVLPIEKNGKKFYVNHLWVKTERVKGISHGFKTIKVKVIEYDNLYDGSKKYGVKFLEVIK